MIAYAVTERDKDPNSQRKQHAQDYECHEDGSVVQAASRTGNDREYAPV